MRVPGVVGSQSNQKVSLPSGLNNSNGYAVKITFNGTIPAPQ